MSALEQIRKRPGLIISILGLALVLFIFTAISNPEKLFSDPTTIAKVDGHKIDRDAFMRRCDELRENYKRQGYQDVDNALIQEQAMQSLIDEALMENELQHLGITVSGEELTEAMMGQNIPMIVQQLYYQRQQQGLPSGRDLYEIAYNPTQYGLDAEAAAQYKQAWMDLEKQVAEMLKQQKFANLIYGTIAVNNLDARAQYEDNNTTSKVKYTKVDLSSVPDTDVEVSDADLKKQYDADKSMYRLNDDTSLLSYIMTEVTPSEEDRLEATRAVEDALAALRANEGIEGLGNNFVVNRYNNAIENIPSAIGDKIATLAQDTVMQISFYDNVYTLAKYLGQSTAVDKVKFDVIGIAEGQNVDSIMARLNAGATIESLGDSIVLQKQLDQEISLLGNGSQFAPVFAGRATGVYFNAPDYTGSPNMVLRLVSQEAPVATYNVAEITYHLEPSSATINDAQARLRSYVAKNDNAQAFTDNATAAGYDVMTARVTKNSRSVNNIPETGALAKWAVETKKGKVSDVMSDNGKTMFIAGTVTNKYDKGFAPMTDPLVDAQVRAKVLRAKKAEKLLAEYQGKGNSVETYATAMKAKVDTTDITFGQNYARGFMAGDGKLLAIVDRAPEAKVQGPAATDYTVVVFEVMGREKSGREFDATNDGTYFQQTLGAQPLLRNFQAIMRHDAKIDNKIQKFFND